ncbi:initiation factor 2 [Marasmius fiardii PR-910]|nr:initiation factor 2 [Marasmius fiardii PR-910]
MPSSSQSNREQKFGLSSKKENVKKPKTFVERKIRPDVYIPSVVSVGNLAQLLNVRLEQLQHRMKRSGMVEEASYDHVLTSDYAILLTEEFGRSPIVSDEMAFDIYPSPPHPNPSTLPHRPPVVTIMGHVDHGKTTLLDTLRSASVAKGEAGGITQHIGAFSVPVPPNTNSTGGPKSITFLDTPGHAAFSAMRARGAGVTDIVVLVVAADDGIMPQTREVIEIIKKERDNLGLVVAINKVDKPGVDEAVQKSLLSEGIQLEAFGGDVPSVAVSGLTGHGLPELVETLSAIAEMQDLRAEIDGPVHGHILESKVHKGLGAVATVLVSRGSLKLGSHIISGTSHAKARVMTDSAGKSIYSACPGMTVTVSGWKALPNAGDIVLQGSDSDVKKAVANRERKAELDTSLLDVEAINNSRREERERRELEADGKTVELKDESTGPKELRLIVKADVSGSAEAVVGALQGIGNHLATTRIISSGVGDVTESDVTLAKTAGGMIVAFNVNVPRSMEVLAAQINVPISSSGIIYRLIEEVKDHVVKLLPVVIEKTVTGEATVLQVFEIQLKSKQTTKVAGCRVFNGVVERTKQARVLRNGEIIHEGSVETLRQVKKDVTEVRKGSECGLNLAGFSDLQEGDVIQMFAIIERPGIL